MNEIENPEIKSVFDILDIPNLNIPIYQRPYKWERRHMRNLFHDLHNAMKKKKDSVYRIGSIILHNNDKKMDIVDGQQRLISLSLLLHAIRDKLYTKYKLPLLPAGAKNLLEETPFIEKSIEHARKNYDECLALCNLNSTDNLDLLRDLDEYTKKNCKLFVIKIPKDALSEAFQLFDSQNNRGKALKPHDLLKAYHLRAIEKPSEKTIEKWEQYVNNKEFKLEDLFDKHLFRIRHWINGSTGLIKKKRRSELRFSEQFIDDFKGITLKEDEESEEKCKYPYLDLYRKLQNANIVFPYSLTMPIINGEAFFKFVEHSYGRFEFFFKKDIENYVVKEAKEFLCSSESRYAKNNNLYINLVALFIDRFGIEEIYKDEKKNLEVQTKMFFWAYYTRTKAWAIHDSTIANFAAEGKFQNKEKYQKMFQLLATSSSPSDFVAKIDIERINTEDIRKKSKGWLEK